MSHRESIHLLQKIPFGNCKRRLFPHLRQENHISTSVSTGQLRCCLEENGLPGQEVIWIRGLTVVHMVINVYVFIID